MTSAIKSRDIIGLKYGLKFDTLDDTDTYEDEDESLPYIEILPRFDSCNFPRIKACERYPLISPLAHVPSPSPPHLLALHVKNCEKISKAIEEHGTEELKKAAARLYALDEKVLDELIKEMGQLVEKEQ